MRRWDTLLVPGLSVRCSGQRRIARMTTTSLHTRESEVSEGQEIAGNREISHKAIAWTSFFFALLQSFCTFFGAANGLRLFIGIGAIALSSSAAAFVREFHSSWFRRPMNGLALAGAI